MLSFGSSMTLGLEDQRVVAIANRLFLQFSATELALSFIFAKTFFCFFSELTCELNFLIEYIEG